MNTTVVIVNEETTPEQSSITNMKPVTITQQRIIDCIIAEENYDDMDDF